MDIKSLQEKRNKLVADATAIMQGDNVTAEQRSQFDAMMADAEVVNGDIARIEAAEKAQAELRSAKLPARPNPGESNDPEERAEVRNARQKASFRKYIQTGVVESRDLTYSSTAGVVVPQAFDADVFEAQKSWGDVYNLVNVMKTSNGEPTKLVLDDDTANSLTIVTTGTDVSDVDPILTTKLLQVSPYTTSGVRVGIDLLNDSGFDLEAFIRDKFGKRYFRGVASLIYNGDSGNVASLASAITDNITSASAGALKFADFATAIGTLDPAYQGNAVWAVNNSTLGYISGLSDSNNRPLFLPGLGDASQGFVGTILGKPVRLVTQMPSVAAGNQAVLFGDFKAAYTFRQVEPGLSVIRLNERYAPSYEVGFVGFCRIGGASTIPNTSNPPVIGINIHS